MTGPSLATALGLKNIVYGTGNHAVYYIDVDGVTYVGSNAYLNLEAPAHEDDRWNGRQ